MKCDSKTMIKMAVGLGIALVAAYVLLPAAHAFILSSAPILLALICPVAMLFMMKGMHSGRTDDNAKREYDRQPPGVHQPGPDKP